MLMKMTLFLAKVTRLLVKKLRNLWPDRRSAKLHSLDIIFEKLDAELKYKDKMAKNNRNNYETEIYYEQTNSSHRLEILRK